MALYPGFAALRPGYGLARTVGYLPSNFGSRFSKKEFTASM